MSSSFLDLWKDIAFSPSSAQCSGHSHAPPIFFLWAPCTLFSGSHPALYFLLSHFSLIKKINEHQFLPGCPEFLGCLTSSSLCVFLSHLCEPSLACTGFLPTWVYYFSVCMRTLSCVPISFLVSCDQRREVEVLFWEKPKLIGFGSTGYMGLP